MSCTFTDINLTYQPLHDIGIQNVFQINNKYDFAFMPRFYSIMDIICCNPLLQNNQRQ